MTDLAIFHSLASLGERKLRGETKTSTDEKLGKVLMSYRMCIEAEYSQWLIPEGTRFCFDLVVTEVPTLVRIYVLSRG